MKILFFSHYSFLYGSNRSMESLILYFKKQGIDVEVMLPTKGKFSLEMEQHGVKVHTLRFFYQVLYIKFNVKYLILPALWLYNLIVFPVLLLKVKAINPDILYTNCSLDGYGIWIAKILGKKHVTHIREFMYEDFGARYLFGRKAKRWYLKKSDKLICVSHAVANMVLGGIPMNARVIYNGVKMPQRVKLAIPPATNQIRLGIVGILDIAKQQHKAIEYMPDIEKRFPGITLHIIGNKECTYKAYIKHLTKSLKLENVVVFEGFVENVEDIYDKLDILLMCSRYEAFGRVTVEAMLRRVPVIGFDSGGTSELIENVVTGFKFRKCSDIIQALDKLVNEPHFWQQLVEKAQEVAIEKFNEERYVHDVYDFIVNNK